MLFEGLTYADDFPMNISIVHVEEDPLHYHIDIEFVYVLRGEIRLENGCHSYELHEGDIFTNTGHEVHRLAKNSDDNVVAILQISTRYFSRYFPNLSQSVYRSYSQKSNTKKHDRLRGLLLQILQKYAVKSSNYKSECASLVIDTVQHMNKYFNLFAFDQDLVVSFDRGNPVAVERISRIYTYIYQYYADNITLEDLSEMEHLSSYYVSHLVRSFTGLSFRELLCFARVAWSQINLLETNSKVSQIARDVGFSTTAYYEKYFQKWFHMHPQEYRQTSLPTVKSDLRPAVLEPLGQDQVIEVIKQAHARHNLRQDDSAVIVSHSLEASINISAPALARFDKQLAVKVTVDDYKVLGFEMFSALAALTPSKVVLLRREKDSAEELRALTKLLRSNGFRVEKGTEESRGRTGSYAYDSVAYPIHLIKKCTRSQQSQLEVHLRDTGRPGQLLQGQDGVLTAGGVRKPAFYAYQILSALKGEIIAQSTQYCAVRMSDNGAPVFAVLAYNDNDAVQGICLKSADARQTKDVLNDFRDEINLSAGLNLLPGTYSVARYSMDRSRNIFACLADLDFQEEALISLGSPEIFSAAPTVEVYMEEVRTAFTLHFSMKGAGLQMAVVKLLKSIR